MSIPMVRLKEVANFVNGKAFQPTDWSEAGVPIIRIQNLNGLDKPFNYWAGPLDKEVRVQHKDLLLAWSGTPGTSFGAHIWGGGAAVLNQHIFRVDLNEKRVTKEWAKFVINARLSTLIGLAHGGVGLKHVTKGMVEGLEIPVPPLPEQRRIAAILDQADALRAKRREALAQLDSLTKSIFIEMFGDPVTNTNNWQPVQLADVSDIVTGFAFKSEEYVDDNDSSIKLCRGANVMPGRLDWSDLASWPALKTEQVAAFTLQVGDIVMAMDRPWISEGFKVAQITKNDCPSLLVQRVARVRGRGNVTNEYLYHLLNHPAFTAHCRPTETTIPHISPREIRSFQFHLPPANLQQDFVKRVSCLNHLKSRQVESLKELESLFASLQHRAFRGDL